MWVDPIRLLRFRSARERQGGPAGTMKPTRALLTV